MAISPVLLIFQSAYISECLREIKHLFHSSSLVSGDLYKPTRFPSFFHLCMWQLSSAPASFVKVSLSCASMIPWVRLDYVFGDRERFCFIGIVEGSRFFGWGGKGQYGGVKGRRGKIFAWT